jgi:hypothetical protein
MRKLTSPLVVVLALAIVVVSATTASAKKAEAPHFETHAVGTFDYVKVGEYNTPTDGVWWSPADGPYVVVEDSIRLEVDIESVGDAFGPYDDGSDWDTKWDYAATGYLKVKFDVISPDGHPIRRSVKADVDKVTLTSGRLGTHYFFAGTYHGMPYSGYLGLANEDWHLYLPLPGQFLGGDDNYGIVHSSDGDFSYVLDDILTP